jgi:hypothetical protein
MNVANLINQMNQSLNVDNPQNLKSNVNNDDFTKLLLNLVSANKGEISSDMLVNLSDLGQEISQNLPDLLLTLFANKGNNGLLKFAFAKNVPENSEKNLKEEEANSDKESITIPVEVLMQLVANIIKENHLEVENKVEESLDNAKEATLQKKEMPESLEELEIIDKKKNALKMPEVIADTTSGSSIFENDKDKNIGQLDKQIEEPVVLEEFGKKGDTSMAIKDKSAPVEALRRADNLDKQLVEYIVSEKPEKKESLKMALGEKGIPIKEVKEAFFNEMFSHKEIENNPTLDNLILMHSPNVVAEEKTVSNKKDELIKVEKLDSPSFTAPVQSEPAKNNKIYVYDGKLENKSFDKALEIAKFDDRVYLKKESPESISMLIETKEIGKVKVNLSINDGIVKAEVYPNTEQARTYFKENMDKIFATLHSEGINLGQFVLKDNRDEKRSEKTLKEDMKNGEISSIKIEPVVKKASNNNGLSIYV